jgi:hypothetical protein
MSLGVCTGVRVGFWVFGFWEGLGTCDVWRSTCSYIHSAGLIGYV